MPGLRAVLMIQAIADGHAGEHYQCCNLYNVDPHVHGRGAVDSAVSDVSHPDREHDTEQPHEQRAVVSAAEGARPKLACQIPAQNCRYPYHQPWIHPVIQMTRPAGKKL